MNLDSKLRKAGITPSKVTYRNNRAPAMTDFLQSFVIVGICIDY